MLTTVTGCNQIGHSKQHYYPTAVYEDGVNPPFFPEQEETESASLYYDEKSLGSFNVPPKPEAILAGVLSYSNPIWFVGYINNIQNSDEFLRTSYELWLTGFLDHDVFFMPYKRENPLKGVHTAVQVRITGSTAWELFYASPLFQKHLIKKFGLSELECQELKREHVEKLQKLNSICESIGINLEDLRKYSNDGSILHKLSQIPLLQRFLSINMDIDQLIETSELSSINEFKDKLSYEFNPEFNLKRYTQRTAQNGRMYVSAPSSNTSGKPYIEMVKRNCYSSTQQLSTEITYKGHCDFINIPFFDKSVGKFLQDFDAIEMLQQNYSLPYILFRASKMVMYNIMNNGIFPDNQERLLSLDLNIVANATINEMNGNNIDQDMLTRLWLFNSGIIEMAKAIYVDSERAIKMFENLGVITQESGLDDNINPIIKVLNLLPEETRKSLANTYKMLIAKGVINQPDLVMKTLLDISIKV